MKASRNSIWRLFGLVTVAIVLSIVTQIGGLIVLAVAWVARWRRWSAWRFCLVAVLTYSALSLFAIPSAARLLGRERLPCFARPHAPYGAVNPLLCALNRTYVRPETAKVVASLANEMAKRHPGTVTRYLDANFPFMDGFPLVPHLSHDDGHKVDLAYFYTEPTGKPVLDGAASPLGYWAYEAPALGEERPCAHFKRFNLRWDFAGLQSRFHRRADTTRTADMLTWLTTEGRRLGVSKILIEPHLKARWAPGAEIVRFQGCRAARHDDHLHIETKPAA